jgi:GNAT superfamily N-acetyltransferase
MSVLYPTKAKLQALRDRWIGEEKRLAAIADAMLRGQDWTIHLNGLPHVGDIPPLPGEVLGRDLRGADLRRHLRPAVQVKEATETEAALVASITWEAMHSTTPLPAGSSPFPVELQSAEEMAIAMRQGETFLLAYVAARPVGVVRLATRREFRELAGRQDYVEVSGLAVLPAHRRGGIGGRLLEAAEAIARSDGHAYVLLRTTYEFGLVPYYEGRGYVVGRVRQLQYPSSPTFLDVILTKRLPAGTETNGVGTVRRAERVKGDATQ